MAHLFLQGPFVEMSVGTWCPVMDGPLSIQVAAGSPCNRGQAQRAKEKEKEREREREREAAAGELGRGSGRGGMGARYHSGAVAARMKRDFLVFFGFGV